MSLRKSFSKSFKKANLEDVGINSQLEKSFSKSLKKSSLKDLNSQRKSLLEINKLKEEINNVQDNDKKRGTPDELCQLFKSKHYTSENLKKILDICKISYHQDDSFEQLCHKLSSNRPDILSKSKWWLLKLIINIVNYKTINRIIILYYFYYQFLYVFNLPLTLKVWDIWLLRKYESMIPIKDYKFPFELQIWLPRLNSPSIAIYGTFLIPLLIYVFGLRKLSYGPVKEMLQSYDVNKYLKKIDQQKKKSLKKLKT